MRLHPRRLLLLTLPLAAVYLVADYFWYLAPGSVLAIHGQAHTFCGNVFSSGAVAQRGSAGILLP